MKNKKTRSLRAFMLVTIGTALLCCTLIITLIFQNNMSRMLEQAEQEHMEELSHAIKGSMATTLYNLRSNTRTWSSWEEPYYYILGENDSFIDNNLADGTMLTLYKVDFVYIKDLEGNDLYAGSRSEPPGVPRLVPPEGLSQRISEIAATVLANQDPFYVYNSDGQFCDGGFVVINGQSYMLCVMPVYVSDESGLPVGSFTFAVRYGDEEIKELTHLETTHFYVNELENPDSSQLDNYWVKEENVISMSTIIPNISNNRDAVLVFDHPRALYTNGRSLVTTTMTMLFSAIILVMAVMYLLIYRFLLRPLGGLIAEVGRVGQKVAINTEKYNQYEELYTLSSAINGMLQRLEQSYQAAEETKVSLNVLANILNGLDAYLYVSDTVSDEILFINDSMRSHFDLAGEGIGQICWKVLQSGFESRCEFCPCYQLDRDPDTPVVWEEYNTLTNRYYRNTDIFIDWVGGRKAHLQHSVDITDLKMAQFTLDRRLGQQALMTAISQSFITNTDVDTLIANALRMTGEFLGIAQVLFYRLEEDGVTLSCQSEWVNPDITPMLHLGGKLKLEGSMLAILNGLTEDREFYLSSEDPILKVAMAPYRANFENYITTPIFVKDKVYGVLDFSRGDEQEWNESDINLVSLLSSLLSGVFDRRLMEDQLRRLSSIVESSPQFIFYITADGKVDYVNPAAVSITGYSESELLEGGLDIIFDAQTVREIKELHIPQTLRDSADNFEINLLCKDGRQRIMAFSSFTTGLGCDNVGGIASDVTEMRRLEAELIAAKELAEQGSRSKSEFLSRMSHEMRTPMNAIIGMTNIAIGSDDPEKKEYCLGRIDNASRHLLGVINDILDMSKIEADKFDLNYAEFDFERMLHNVLDVINVRMEEKQQELSLHIDPVLPKILIGDEQRLSQVITNLLTNAVKFTPEQGLLQLSASVLGEENGSLGLRIEICDNGIGISPEQQAKLFRPFEQADGSIARKFGGTGLGLAISRRIVELMGGEIWVESELGQGSKFVFTIKVEVNEENIRNHAEKAMAEGAIKEPEKEAMDDEDFLQSYEGKVALLAEDVDINREIILTVLEDTRLRIECAENGRQAVEMYAANPGRYDIIFMDVHMPEVDGLEATRRIRELAGTGVKRIPIVAMTADVFHEDIAKCLEAGMDDHIGKPINFDELFRKLRLYLG